LRLETEELLAEYLKAVDMLTVSQEKQLQQENVKLRMEVADVDKLRSEVSQVSTLKQELYELREQNKWLDQQVNKILKQGKLDKKYQRVKKILRRSDSRIAEESEEMASE
jgi:Tfp pilus assembly protein PilN